MKKMIFSMLTLFVLSSASMNAQVRIGGIDDPNVSAVLDLNATDNSNDGTLGLLLPRVRLTSTTDVTTIKNPAAGLMVYNTLSAGNGITAVVAGVYYYDGNKWMLITVPEVDWIIGNEVTDATTGGGLVRAGEGTNAAPWTLGIATDGVTNARLADGSVNSAKIEDKSIVAADLADKTVTGAKIADATIDSTKIAAATVGVTRLKDNSVNSAKIIDGAVTLAKIAASVIDSTKIKDGAVGLSDLATNSVNSAKIINGSIVATDLADGAVTLAKIAASVIDSTKIKDGAVGLSDLATNSVNSAKIINGSIVAADLADNSVNSAKIVNASIVAADLNQMGAASGQFLRWNGSAWTPSAAIQVLEGGFTVTADGTGARGWQSSWITERTWCMCSGVKHYAVVTAGNVNFYLADGDKWVKNVEYKTTCWKLW